MTITASNSLKLALRTYTDDGEDAATTTRTQIGSGYKVKVFKVGSPDTEVASGTAAGSLGGTGVNVTVSALSLTASANATPGVDSLYARVEKSDASVWVRGSAGLAGSGSDFILSGPIISGQTLTATLAFDFPPTGGGGGTYVPSTPPGAVSRWLRQSTDAGFYVPLTFVGLHRDGGVIATGQSYPAPDFSFDAVRAHDGDGTNYSVPSQWARIDSNADGTPSWTEIDYWYAHSDVDGKPIMWPLMGCPDGFQKYPDEDYPYGYLRGGGSPPDDAADLADHVDDLITHFPEIFAIEIANEPKHNNAGPNLNTYDTRDDSFTDDMGGHSDCFYTGSAEDLVVTAKAVKDALAGSGVLTVAAAWTNQETIEPYWGAMQNAIYRFATCEHPTATGTYGRDYCDALSIHLYLSGLTVNSIIDSIANYRETFVASGLSLSLPLYVTEFGFFNTTDNAGIASQIKRGLLICAGLGISGVYLYKYSVSYIGVPHENSIVGDKIDEARGVRGKTVRQAAELSDGRVWVECEDGTQIIE